MRRSGLLGLGLIIVAVLMFSAWSDVSHADWYTPITINSGNVGYRSDLAVDPQRKVHVSYHAFSGSLMYANNASGTWVNESPSNVSGDYTSIAVGADGKVFISYNNAGNGYVASGNAGSWDFDTVYPSSSYNITEGTSIAVDSWGNVHVVYYDSGFLRYATGVAGPSGFWSTYDVDSDGVGNANSLALDSKKNAHISYYDSANGYLKYATGITGGSGTTWLTDTVDSSGAVGSYNSIAVDAKDNIHISYYDAATGDLKYAKGITGGSGSTWLTDTVDSSGVVGSYNSIAVDANGNVHISYQDSTNSTNGHLKYAMGVPGPSGMTWSTTPIDSSGNTGFDTAVAVDASNMVHISYRDANTGALKYIYSGYNLTVTKSGAGHGFVTSSIPGINCDLANTDCSDVYGPGSVVTLNAVPELGSYFGGWSWPCGEDTCNSQALEVRIPMDASTNVTITFTSTPPSVRTWSETFGQNLTGERQLIDLIQQTRDGGYIAAGSAFNPVAEYDDFWVVKLDGRGVIQWQKAYKKFFTDLYNPYDDRAHSILQTSDGGYIVAGDANNVFNTDAWILKLDKDGNIVWDYTYKASFGADYAYSVQQTADGGYILAGSTSSVSVDQDLWIMKLDGSGSPVWSKTYSTFGMDEAREVKQTSDGGYIVIGKNGSGVGTDIWIMKLDGKGNYDWQQVFGGGSSILDEGYSIKQTRNGEYIAAGMESGLFWAARLYNNGTVRWEKTFGTSGSANSIQETLSGDIIVAGEDNAGIWAMYLTPDGDLGTGTWQKTYQFGPQNRTSSIQQTSDGGFVLSAGYIDGEDTHVLLMKLDLNGDIPGCGGVTITPTSDAGSGISEDGVLTFIDWRSDFTIVRDLLYNGAATASVPNAYVCGAPAPPRISVSPSSPYNFGNVVAGLSAARTFTITNTGDLDLILGQIANINPLSAPFSLSSDNCSGHTIHPLGTCTFVSNFSPVSVGTFTDTFDVPSNDPTGPLTIELRGTGAVQMYSLYVIKTGTGTGTVVSSEATAPLINCGTNCSDVIVSYPGNTQVKLQATADTGSVFTGWGGACTGTSDCDMVMNANKTVSAKFALNTLTISTQAGQGGGISPTGETVNYGGTALFTVTPNDGYHTVNVSGCGVTKYEGGVIAAKKKKKNVKGSAAGEVYITGPITESCMISASFAINTFTVTPSAGEHGNIDPSTQQTVNYNDTIIFSLKADDGYHIASVSGCGGTAYTAAKKKKKKKLSSVSEMTYTTGHITESCSVAASFAINTFTVTPKAGAHGSIDPSTPQTVNYHDTVSFTVNPDAGYHIESVTGCGVHSSEGGAYITEPVTGDCTVEAAFAKETFTATILKSGTGSGAVTGNGITCEGNACGGTYEAGSKLTLKIKPDDGYRVIDVKINGKSVGPVQTITLKEIISNFTIEIVFGPV